MHSKGERGEEGAGRGGGRGERRGQEGVEGEAPPRQPQDFPALGGACLSSLSDVVLSPCTLAPPGCRRTCLGWMLVKGVRLQDRRSCGRSPGMRATSARAVAPLLTGQPRAGPTSSWTSLPPVLRGNRPRVLSGQGAGLNKRLHLLTPLPGS